VVHGSFAKFCVTAFVTEDRLRDRTVEAIAVASNGVNYEIHLGYAKNGKSLPRAFNFCLYSCSVIHLETGFLVM